jgi:hypothetical protein
MHNVGEKEKKKIFPNFPDGVGKMKAKIDLT